jgi:hypothetical protein
MPSITLVSDYTQTIDGSKQKWSYYKALSQKEVKLLISPDATRKELEAYIDKNWKSIKKQLTNVQGMPRKRIRIKTKAKRNAGIVRMYRSGMSYQSIADCLNDLNIGNNQEPAFTAKDIKLIISRSNLKPST